VPSSGDDRFELAVLPHIDAAYNLAHWLMRDAKAAEDVLEEAMLRAATCFLSAKSINPRARLLQIVHHAAYGSTALNRGASPLGTVGESIDTTVAAKFGPGEYDPKTGVIPTCEHQRLRALVTTLPVELREALVLREFEEFSYQEIAEATETPIGTVMSRLWQARQILAQTPNAGGSP
jgi:RNA polymerase sigma-70 factor, ECF subfamily